MKLSKKLIAAVLAFVMLICMIPATSLAEEKGGKAVDSVSFATMSDIHICPQELTPENGTEAYEKWLAICRNDSKEYEESEFILQTALKTLKARYANKGIKYLLMPGDLTMNSELIGHQVLARIMEEFERETGIEVVAINGNHDVNTTRAASFVTGESVPTEAITAQGFYETYKNLGYDLADSSDPTSFYGIENGKIVPKANALSYFVDLNGESGKKAVRLFAVDSNKYSFGETAKEETSGAISDECLEWICSKADEANALGLENILMVHHNMVPHMECEPSVTFAFNLDDYLRVSETLADHDVHYSFTGHLHQADVAKLVNDNGEVMYDCETGSLTSFPNTYRENKISIYSDGETSMEYENVAFDEAAAFTIDGKTYEKGGFLKTSFGLTYGGPLGEKGDGTADGLGFVKCLLNGYAGGIIKEIKNAKGILPWVKEKFGVDVEKILQSFLEPYIGKGIVLGDNSFLSVKNIMWFLEDLCSQVEETYLQSPDQLYEAVKPAVSKILNFKVSDYTVSDEVLKNTGVGKGHTYGTLEDLIFSAVYYFYTGNEPKAGEDKLIDDATAQLDKGIQEIGLFDMLLDAVLNDLLDDAILSKLDVRVNKFFNSDYFSQQAAKALNIFVKKFLRNDTSYSNLVDTIFEFGVLPYSSIYDTLDKLLIQEYWSDSQDESIGQTLSYFIRDFALDTDPAQDGDYNVTYYSYDEEVPVTTANYRKPTMISVTMGEDAKTGAYINWFSKNTLKSADIVLFDENGKDITNDTTDSVEIKTDSKLVDRYFPGIDLGIFGLFKYNFTMYQHTVTLTGLKPGTTYTYKVGNAEKGWWSDTGSVTTADGSNDVTFFHTSDPQAQSQDQYARGWANVLDKAFKLYPDAKFVVCAGDLVDYGMNNHMWQWMFDTASKNLMNTYLMPVTGNHEEKDDYSTVSNFVLPNVPEQDTASGVYYSYDYNNVHIAVLNTNDLNDDDALSEKQIEWLKKDMNASKAEWKLVTLHKALYSNGSHYDDDDVCAMRKQLGALMPQLGIDLVLQAHDHVYLRTFSLDSNKKVQESVTYLTYDNKDGDSNNLYKTYENPTGTFYSISGCAGVKIYKTKDVAATDKLFPRAEKIIDAYTSMFTAIQIKDGILYFNAYLVDGDKTECVDQFAIRKDQNQGTLYDGEWPKEEEIKEPSKLLTFIEKVFEVMKKVLVVLGNIVRMYIIETNIK